MPDRHPITFRILGGCLAGVREACRLFDRKRVHVGAQHDGGAITVAQKADDARLADPRRHLVAGGAQAFRREVGRPRFAHRELWMRMNILVERLEVREQANEAVQDRLAAVRFRHTHGLTSTISINCTGAGRDAESPGGVGIDSSDCPPLTQQGTLCWRAVRYVSIKMGSWPVLVIRLPVWTDG